MARTFKSLLGDVARQQKLDVEIRAAEQIRKLQELPGKAYESVGQIKEQMTTRVEVMQTTLEAKTMIRDHLMESISDEEFAYRLAQNENLRKSMQQLTQQVLHPTPVEHIRSNHGNPYVDIGAGVSAFWDTVRQATPVELSEASEIENILMSVEAGLDKDMEPDTRKSMLAAAGMTTDQIKELVPLSAYVEYENHIKDTVREQIRTEMGLSEAEMAEERNQLLLESLTEDAMMNGKLQIDDEAADYEPTYEDMYGMSAESLYDLFGESDVSETQVADGTNVPVDDASWGQYLEESHAMEHLQELYDMSVEEHQELLSDYESYLMQEAQQMEQTEEPLQDFEDALAQMDDFPPQEITDADLEALAAMQEDDMLIGG
jgi:hypothetical protein